MNIFRAKREPLPKRCRDFQDIVNQSKHNSWQERLKAISWRIKKIHEVRRNFSKLQGLFHSYKLPQRTEGEIWGFFERMAFITKEDVEEVNAVSMLRADKMLNLIDAFYGSFNPERMPDEESISYYKVHLCLLRVYELFGGGKKDNNFEKDFPYIDMYWHGPREVCGDPEGEPDPETGDCGSIPGLYDFPGDQDPQKGLYEK